MRGREPKEQEEGLDVQEQNCLTLDSKQQRDIHSIRSLSFVSLLITSLINLYPSFHSFLNREFHLR